MRALKFIAIGAVLGLIGSLLWGYLPSSRPRASGEIYFLAAFGVVGGAILGFSAQILTREKVAGETFLPKQSSESPKDSNAVLICTGIGAILGLAAIMIGNIVFRVVPGGFIGGVIGGSAGATIGRVFGQALFPHQKLPPNTPEQ